MKFSGFFADVKTIFIPEKRSPARIDQVEYARRFNGRQKSAFNVAIEARKFEIQMYWTRTAYFWTLTAAALTGFFASIDKVDKIYTFVITCIGVILSLGWALANKGSKYWHENWENHVQMLEDVVIGPLHKTLLYRGREPFGVRYDWVSQVLTGPSGFSVSKINSIFSWFFFLVWIFLSCYMIPKCSYNVAFVVEWPYIILIAITLLFIFVLFRFSGSWAHDQEHEARHFEETIIPPP